MASCSPFLRKVFLFLVDHLKKLIPVQSNKMTASNLGTVMFVNVCSMKASMDFFQADKKGEWMTAILNDAAITSGMKKPVKARASMKKLVDQDEWAEDE